jgi:hypothetical protein
MIIKSMSRKHPSFDQLIDYMESERKLKSRRFSIYRNTYTQNSNQLKTEFTENSKHLKFRKNGVYLYHEIVSIKRAEHISEDQQKEILQNIVSEYLKVRAKNNLAYAVLHEDKTDNLHYHILISANEAEESQRKRLSKADFAEIQTRMEAWVLETYPELEQKAVFAQNQTEAEREESQRKARISNRGRERERRTGTTDKRDTVKETLETIFRNSTDGRDFTERLHEVGFTLYQRGKQYGITDRDGIKYRFSTLGLADAWEALDKRMMEELNQKNQKAERNTERIRTRRAEHQQAPPEPQEAREATAKTEPKETENHEATEQRMKPNPFETAEEAINPEKREERQKRESEQTAIDEEAERRRQEMEAIRQARASHQSGTSHKNQSS